MCSISYLDMEKRAFEGTIRSFSVSWLVDMCQLVDTSRQMSIPEYLL